MITLTDTAVEQVKQLIVAENDDNLVLRVEVAPGGCSGLSYAMYFDTDIRSDDVTIDQDGVRVIADPMSAEKLVGATLHYKIGLDASGFEITNPNAGGGRGGGGCGGGGCGCGKGGGHGHGHG